MSRKSINQEQTNSFSNVHLFWGFSPRSPQFNFLQPLIRKQTIQASNSNNSVLSQSMSISADDNSNDLSKLSADISTLLQSCVSQSQNRTSTSSGSQLQCLRESRSYVNKNMQLLEVYLEGHELKKNFEEIVRICLIDKFNNTEISQQWNCENLFKSFCLVRLDHPFLETFSPKLEGLQTFFLNWIQSYDSNKRLIVSFDFLLSHLTLILVLIFYWFHVYEPKQNPLCSLQQNQQIQNNLQQTRRSISLILIDYVNLRSRDVSTNITYLECNIISAKLLNEFYKYVETLGVGNSHMIQQSHELLQQRFQFQAILMQNLTSSLEFSQEILKQMDVNYFQKDKMIKDSILDLVQVFNLVDMKAFINTPLSAYYDTEQLKVSKQQAVNRQTYLSCWLIKIVVQGSKRGGYIGIQYIRRYLQMGEQFLKSKNCESGLLFVSVILTLKQSMPTLWQKYRQKYNVNETTLASLLQCSQNFSLSSLIPHKVKIFQRIQLAKQKFKNKYLLFRFHQTIYQIARIVTRCKQNIQKQFKCIQTKKPKIKVNYNQSYLHHHIYKIMKQQCHNPSELFESMKNKAFMVDKQITFSLFGFSIF